MVPTTRQYLRGINLQQIYIKIGFVFFILILWYLLSNIVARYDLVLKAVLLAIYYFILNILFTYGRMIIIYLYRRRHKLAVDHMDNFTLGINRIGFILNHFIFVLIFIHVVFINVWTFITSLSIVAVALVIIFKDYLTNFIIGIILMFSKDFQLRQYIKIGDYAGRIHNITFEHIELLNDAGDIVFVPNSLAYTKEIVNYSSSNRTKRFTFTFTLPIASYSHYQAVKDAIKTRLLQDFPETFTQKEDVDIHITGLSATEMTCSVSISTKKLTPAFETACRDAVHDAVLKQTQHA